MPPRQYWAPLSREFERNPPSEESIIQFLDLLETQPSRVVSQVYYYILELFTHGPILPRYLPIIFRQFDQRNVRGPEYPTLYHYYQYHPSAHRVFETLERHDPDQFSSVWAQIEMEFTWM